MKAYNYTPVIIIGATRSGTTILKRCLSRIEGFGAFPNEINFIWCHGNTEFHTDELEPHHATTNTKRFIRERFKEFAQENNLAYLIEKTSANSLRVPFVYEVFPDAKFIFMVRDGRDVIASMLEQSFHNYSEKKPKRLLLKEIPFVILKWIKQTYYRLVHTKESVAIKGPRFNGIEDISEHYSFEEVCALQWKISVEKAKHAFAEIPVSQMFKLHYEQFVTDPEKTIMELLKFLGIKLSYNDAREIVKDVHPHGIGKWRKDLSPELMEQILPIIQEALKSENYIKQKSSV